MLTTSLPSRTTSPSALGPTIHAEWTKLRTSRATTVSVAVALIGAVALSALVLAGQRSEWSTMTATARAAFDPTSKALVGVIVAALVVGALGVRTIASEHATGMIRLTFTAMPRRRLVLATKAGLIAAAGIVIALVANTVAVVVGQRILEPTGVATGLADPGARRAIAFGALGVGLTAVMGVALGSVLRRAAIANIVLALGVIGGQLVGAALPAGARRYLPSSTLEALVTTNPAADTLSPGVALTVLAVETAVLLGLALRAIAHRDA